MILNSIIIDDDIMARRSLVALCKKADTIEVKAVCNNAEEALTFISGNTIDLIFLDIELPGISGIDLLNQLPYLPQVIFTTSKTDYAFEGFEYQITDYLKKPITFPRFNLAVQRATDWQQQIESYKKAAKDLYIRWEGKLVRIAYDDILYFENVGDYVRIITNQENLVIHSTLKSIDNKLTDPRFFRVHRSFIINLDKIREIEENVLHIGGQEIPISRSNKPVLLNRLNIL